MKGNISLHKLTIGLALLTLGCHSAYARTWTSVSGTTMEASFVQFDGSQVELETPSGKRMRIGIDRLSEADRDYIQNLNREEMAAPRGGKSGDRQEQPDRSTPQASDPFFGGATLAEPESIPASSLPKVELRNPDSATYWGAQLGPRSEDVAYFIFDQPDIDSLHDILYVYSPGSPQYRVPKKIEARRTKYKKSEEEEFRISRWSDILFTMKNGTLDTRFNFEFSYGIQRPDIAAVVLRIELVGPAGLSRIRTGGYIVEEMATGIGDVTPSKMLGPIRLAAAGVARTTSNSIQANLTMQGRRVIPGRGMPDVIRVQLTDSNGKIRERLKLEIDESLLLRISGGGLSSSVHKLKPLTTYTIDATAGFGPVIGVVTSTREFTTKEPKKKD